MQFAYFLPFAFLGLCLAAFYSGLAPGRRLAACLACGWAASFSFVNGMLLWLVMLPAILRDRRFATTASRRRFAGIWLASAALAAGLYFPGLLENTADPHYRPGFGDIPATVSTARLFQEHPLGALVRAGGFAAAMYGNAVSRGFPILRPVEFSARCGAVLLAAGVALWIALARRGRLAGPAFAWATLALNGFLTAGLVSVGRMWDVPERPLALRYTTYGSFALLGVSALASLALAGPRAESAADDRPAPRDLGFVAIGILVALLGVNWTYGLDLMSEWRATRLATRAVIHFHEQPQVLVSVFREYPDFLEFWAGARPTVLDEGVATLARLGYWHPPLAANARLDQFKLARAPLDAEHGDIESVVKKRSGAIELRGRARFGSAATPELVLFTSADSAGQPVIRAACLTQSPPRWRFPGLGMDAQFLFLLDTKGKHYGRFECELQPSAVPAGESRTLEPWALDFARGRVQRIQVEVVLPEAPTRVR
jgi:hypothetical protein